MFSSCKAVHKKNNNATRRTNPCPRYVKQPYCEEQNGEIATILGLARPVIQKTFSPKSGIPLIPLSSQRRKKKTGSQRNCSRPRQCHRSHHTPQGNTPGIFFAVIHNRSFNKPWKQRHTERQRFYPARSVASLYRWFDQVTQALTAPPCQYYASMVKQRTVQAALDMERRSGPSFDDMPKD